jgi:ComF family protein
LALESFRRLLLPLAAILLPADCLVCGNHLPAEHDGGVCLACWKSFGRLKGACCRRCGDPVFVFEDPVPAPAFLCGECRRRPRAFDRCRSAGIYDGALREAIHKVKFGGETALAKSLGRWLARSLPGEASEADLVAPVPLHPSKLRERGFNQSAFLSAAAAAAAALPHRPRLLTKTTPTRSQTGLGRKERRRNLRGTFSLGPGMAVAARDVLLVDDIYTTGCTVEECARVLKRAGARRVRVLTLARTVR